MVVTYSVESARVDASGQRELMPVAIPAHALEWRGEADRSVHTDDLVDAMLRGAVELASMHLLSNEPVRRETRARWAKLPRRPARLPRKLREISGAMKRATRLEREHRADGGVELRMSFADGATRRTILDPDEANAIGALVGWNREEGRE